MATKRPANLLAAIRRSQDLLVQLRRWQRFREAMIVARGTLPEGAGKDATAAREHTFEAQWVAERRICALERRLAKAQLHERELRDAAALED